MMGKIWGAIKKVFVPPKETWDSNSRDMGFTEADDIFRDLRAKFSTSDDEKYMSMPLSTIKRFVAKYHAPDPSEYRQDAFDCDDYALLTRADMVRGATKEKLDKPVLFGTIVFNRKGEGTHSANITITSDNKMAIYEPQTRQWRTNLDDIENVYRIEY